MEKDNYRQIKEPINSDLYAVQNKDYKWGVVDEDDNVIVPFGKYAWIDGFQNGLAKVISHNDTSSPNHICHRNHRRTHHQNHPSHYHRQEYNPD